MRLLCEQCANSVRMGVNGLRTFPTVRYVHTSVVLSVAIGGAEVVTPGSERKERTCLCQRSLQGSPPALIWCEIPHLEVRAKSPLDPLLSNLELPFTFELLRLIFLFKNSSIPRQV